MSRPLLSLALLALLVVAAPSDAAPLCGIGAPSCCTGDADCDDTDACTGVETCDVPSGTCVAGTAPVCDDGNACTTETCDAATGCTTPVALPGCLPCATVEECNDANVCTTDACQAGRCQHTNNTAPCTDNDACTNGDACQAGACVPGGPLGCDDANACTTDACDAVAGCSHTAITGCVPCTTVAQCNDANVCTTDACQAGRCQHTNNTAPCTDNDACTNGDACQAGACVPGGPLGCDDANACTTDACDAVAGCSHTAITGCVPCTTVAQCNDANLCTTDACQAGRCQHTNNTAPCTDNDACTNGDACQAGACVPGGPLGCDDANACTTDACDAVAGCSHTAITGCVPCTTVAQCNDANVCTTDACQAGRCQHTNNTAPCTDNDACTNGDACQAGACVPGGPLGCDDANACTTDACDAVAGCSHTAITGCVPCTTVAQCNDANLCTTDACQAGRCQHTNNTAPCTDNDACTQVDACQGGSCVGTTPVVCQALDQCHTVGTCNTSTGSCSNPARPDTASCDDADACTTTDHCTAGVCTGTAVVCRALDQCHTVGTCNRSTGTCSNPVRPDTASCDDADACTTTDHCTAGACAGTPIRCDDGVPCTDDRCVGGACAATAIDSRCDRGDCTLGVCRPGDPTANLLGCISTPVGEGDRCTDDGFACTDDRCATGRCLHQPQDDACVATDQCLPALCRPEIDGHDAAGCLPTPQLATGTTCTEDGDACTDDRCQDGTCTHTSVALKTFCSPVQGPYERALALAATARTLAADSTDWSDSPSPSARLLGAASTLEAAADALAGRAATTPAVTQARANNPFGSTPAQERGRVAFTQVRNTPGAVRAFLKDLSAAKARAALAAETAADLRRRGRELLRGTRFLKRDLRRLQGVRSTLAR